MSPALPEFTFVGFEPDEELRIQANRSLDRLLENAPYGSIAVALLEKNEAGYRCSIEIYSRNGPFTGSGSDHTGKGALETVLKILAPRLKRWSEIRDRSRPLPSRVPKPLVC